MRFHKDPRSIVSWGMHALITGRTSGSLTDDSIRNATASRIASGTLNGHEAFDAIMKIAEDAFEAGRESMPNDYRQALWDLQRLNERKLDSLSVHEFIEAHKAEVGIIEMDGFSMTTED